MTCEQYWQMFERVMYGMSLFAVVLVAMYTGFIVGRITKK